MCATGCSKTYVEARVCLFSLVFTRLWHFFLAVSRQITLQNISVFLRFFRTITHATSHCDICVTLLTSLLWTRNVRSCGSGYRLRSSRRLAPIVSSAGFLPWSWSRPKINRSLLLFQTTSTSFGSKVIICRRCRRRSSLHLALRAL